MKTKITERIFHRSQITPQPIGTTLRGLPNDMLLLNPTQDEHEICNLYVTQYNELKESIRSQPKKLTSTIEWVSVEERLPGDYLFRLVISKLSGDTDTAHYLRHQQRWEDPFGDAVEVTHWGELPKFPKTK